MSAAENREIALCGAKKAPRNRKNIEIIGDFL
jgi:hypothetical protein